MFRVRSQILFPRPQTFGNLIFEAVQNRPKARLLMSVDRIGIEFGNALGTLWDALGTLWDALGRSWDVLGTLWECSGALWGRSGTF